MHCSTAESMLVPWMHNVQHGIIHVLVTTIWFDEVPAHCLFVCYLSTIESVFSYAVSLILSCTLTMFSLARRVALTIMLSGVVYIILLR